MMQAGSGNAVHTGVFGEATAHAKLSIPVIWENRF